MAEPNTNSLIDYLEQTIPVTEVVVVPAEGDVAAATIPQPSVPPFPDEEMKELMAMVKRIGMCAKDFHYRAHGKPFYGMHQLADLVYDVEKDTDDIAEIYFMGDRGIEPPTMAEVYGRANKVAVIYPENDKHFAGGLLDICRLTMHHIEHIKHGFEVKSGVAAVLDKISEHCLLSIGLLDQTMKGM